MTPPSREIALPVAILRLLIVIAVVAMIHLLIAGRLILGCWPVFVQVRVIRSPNLSALAPTADDHGAAAPAAINPRPNYDYDHVLARSTTTARTVHAGVGFYGDDEE